MSNVIVMMKCYLYLTFNGWNNSEYWQERYPFMIHIVVMTKMMLLKFMELYQMRVYHAWCLLVIALRARKRILCLHGMKEMSNAWYYNCWRHDNGAVEDVIVYMASYSLIQLIQSLGRIHPARQNHDYATLHIFDTGYDPSRSGDFDCQLNDIKVKNMVPDSTDTVTVEKFYQDLFNIQGYQESRHHCF